ncbi:Polyketide cyclase/dehydrase and lipid transport superfamily protein, partial [Prunus dulcis]
KRPSSIPVTSGRKWQVVVYEGGNQSTTSTKAVSFFPPKYPHYLNLFAKSPSLKASDLPKQNFAKEEENFQPRAEIDPGSGFIGFSIIDKKTWEFLQNRMANEKQLKWEGKASAELNGPEAEQVWPLLEDFFGLHKWFPTLTTCLGVEGISGQPGCVRYCAGFKTPVDHKREQDQDQEKVNWTKQKLLSIDPAQLIFSYSIIDGNVGFNSYISTVQVVPKEGGCSIVWKYEVEPVRGGKWRIWTCLLAQACKSWLAEWKPLSNSKLGRWNHRVITCLAVLVVFVCSAKFKDNHYIQSKWENRELEDLPKTK